MSKLRRNTPKRAARDRQAAKWRKTQIAAVGRCEVCLLVAKPAKLTIHEIARGQHRANSQDKPFATLVVHKGKCHADIHYGMTLAVQLALLKRARQNDFNLEAYWDLIARRFPYAEDIQTEFEKLTASPDNPTAVQPETKPR